MAELHKRKLQLGKQRKDVYVNKLLEFQRKGGHPDERFLDQLLTMALIEARSCERFKRLSEGLDFSPYPGELGARIYNNISKEAFELWKRHQTMLVNENRLNLADAKARQYLARQMEQFLFAGSADQPTGFVPPSA